MDALPCEERRVRGTGQVSSALDAARRRIYQEGGILAACDKVSGYARGSHDGPHGWNAHEVSAALSVIVSEWAESEAKTPEGHAYDAAVLALARAASLMPLPL